jgi:hypothetical protein
VVAPSRERPDAGRGVHRLQQIVHESTEFGAELGDRPRLGAQAGIGIFKDGPDSHGNARVFDPKMLLMF